METKQPNKTEFDKALVKLDEWKAILNHPEFDHTVREYISKRINDLHKISKSINMQNKSLDGSIQLGHQFSKIEELEAMLAHFEKKLKDIRAREISISAA